MLRVLVILVLLAAGGAAVFVSMSGLPAGGSVTASTNLAATAATDQAHLLATAFAASSATLAVALLSSLAVGVVSGVCPARQAARLDPITALRYEQETRP